MSNGKKTNPAILVCAILFLFGMILAGWGWDKNESTIAERTHGAVPMIVIGCIMIVTGLFGFFTVKGKR